VSRGPSGAIEAPVTSEAGEVSDHRLVAAVRQGDDRAFEALYQRYHRRINAYVLGMVKDHGRAEDVTQEVFVSALRRMRATERPIAFKPWIYEIAKNGCIDAFRRSRRAEEVSYDADEALAPADRSRLVGSGPSPDAAVATKQDLADLCGAFGGLSESHHQILVLRELEGLSYEAIGERMGMTRPAVESTLFRARRRLTEEYDELASGARCIRVQGIIAAATSGALGARDSKRLSAHLAHCQSCRREALAAGLDRGLLVRRPLGARVAGRVAAFLPFPAFGSLRIRLRRGAGDVPPPGSGAGMRVAAQFPVFSDHLSSGWGKAATGAVLLIAGLGAGAGARHEFAGGPAGHAAAGRSRGAAAVTPGHPAAATRPAAVPAVSTAAGSTPPAVHDRASAGGSSAPAARLRAKRGSGSGAGSGSGSGAAGGGSSGGSAAGSGASAPDAGGSAAGDTVASAGKTAKSKLPKLGLPVTTSDPVKQVGGAVGETGDAVQGTVQQAAGATQGAVEQAAGAIDGLAGGGPAGQAVQGVTGAVTTTTAGATQAVTDTTGAATTALKDLTGGLLGSG
jgi:RNA polymerase sigma factor (sigma-70 family)